VPILQLQGVSRRFGGLTAVNRVDLEVERGERMTILGPNGAGKTTLFHLISGEVPVSSGRIVFRGRDVTRLGAHRRAALGLRRTYQITNLFPSLTVLQHLQLAWQSLSGAKYQWLRPLRKYGDITARAMAVLEQFGMDDRRDVPVADLSYGEQRELEIAMAVVGQPELLLLDEPLAGLSPAESGRVMEIVNGIADGITVILIEHDVEAALRFARRVTVMHQGAVVMQGTPDEVRSDPRVQEIYLGQDAAGARPV